MAAAEAVTRLSVNLFSWGYWGWGNATRELVSAVDAVERFRGSAPPVFVDIRSSRSVRAVGFRDHAFEQLLGSERYLWLKGLGNQRIENRSGPLIQIADPKAAEELLDVALAHAEARRRIIYFCACERPQAGRQDACHRVAVSRLLLAIGRERGLTIEIVEWPGGEPATLTLEVSEKLLRDVRQQRRSLPLDVSDELAPYAGLAWGSIVELRSSGESTFGVTGPAKFATGKWQLPILSSHALAHDAKLWADAFRSESGYETVAAS